MTKLTAYTIGFVLSIALTILPLVFLWMHDTGGHVFLSPQMLYAAFVILALLQMGVQLSFFLHIDDEAKPRWNLLSFIFAALVVGIVVGGTLWIMQNLAHMQHDTGLPFINGSITPEGSND